MAGAVDEAKAAAMASTRGVPAGRCSRLRRGEGIDANPASRVADAAASSGPTTATKDPQRSERWVATERRQPSRRAGVGRVMTSSSASSGPAAAFGTGPASRSASRCATQRR